ncbi:MAG: hypothetical protein RSA99_04585, partial [Oscillospiraceae bacterium]
MTIFFNGQVSEKYKYELEGIVKLFFPVLHFNFAFNQKNDSKDSYIQFDFEAINPKNTSLFVEAFVNEKKLSEKMIVKTDDAEIERNLSIMAFNILQKITGINPQWGILTGVRPVKLIQDKRKENQTDKEIYDFLHEKYLVSENKLKLAFLTADTQINLLKGNNEKSYSLYISIPFCKTRCSYCSFVSATINSKKSLLKVQPYVDLLCEEIKQTAIIANSLNFILESIYIGGGTPTAIKAPQLEQIMKAIKENFDIKKAKEFGFDGIELALDETGDVSLESTQED